MAATGPIGERLLRAGWDQGVLFTAPSVCFYWNAIVASDDSAGPGTRQVKAREKLVLVTQPCDLREEPTRELYVEALICTVERNTAFLATIDRNSARWFLIDPATGLVAHACYRVQLAKECLEPLTPEPWPADEARRQRFIRWLGQRYGRPAIPDVLVEVFQRPVEAVLHGFDHEQPAVSAAFSQAVHEVRITMPAAEVPPSRSTLLCWSARTNLPLRRPMR